MTNRHTKWIDLSPVRIEVFSGTYAQRTVHRSYSNMARKGALALTALFFMVLGTLTACSTPSLDGAQWKCSSQNDCSDGYVCDLFGGGVCEPAFVNVNGVFDDRLIVGASQDVVSGPVVNLGEGMKNGINAYFNRVNELGGVHGRKLEFIAKDDDNEPEEALSNILELVDGDNRQAFAILGNVGGATTERILPEVVDRRVLLFASLTGASFLQDNNRYVFNLRGSDKDQAAEVTRYFTKNRPQGNISPENIYFTGQAVPGQGSTHNKESLDPSGAAGFDGVSTVLKETFDISSPDIAMSVVERAKINVDAATTRMIKWMASDSRTPISESNDAVEIACIVQLAERPAAQLIINVRDALASAKGDGSALVPYDLNEDEVAALQLIDQVYFAVPGADVDFLNELSGQSTAYCTGILVPAAVPNVDSGVSAAVAFRDDLKQYDENITPTFFAFEGYLAAKLFVAGLQETGRDLTTESLVDTLETLKNVQLGLGVSTGFSSTDHGALHETWMQNVVADGSDFCVFETLQDE